MNILYMNWNELGSLDLRTALVNAGHRLTTLTFARGNLEEDPELEAALESELGNDGSAKPGDGERIGDSGHSRYDCVFSQNFFPIVSRVCQRLDVPYICQVFDSPHLTLCEKEIHNPVNRAYLFDRSEYERLSKAGVKTVQYAPLAVKDPKLGFPYEKSGVISEAAIPDGTRPDADGFLHDITFVGSLYDTDYIFYNQISYLPDHLRGYFEGLFAMQQQLFGIDLFGDPNIVTPQTLEEFHKYVKFGLSESMVEADEDELMRDILRKKVTQLERRALLTRLGRELPIDLYTDPDVPAISGVTNHGYVNYDTKMRVLFNRSRINLNITMRTIRTGIPLRALDIMASGGFLLSTYQDELAEYFTDGEDLVLAHSPGELVELCAYYLEHEEERRQIAENGYRKTVEQFGYGQAMERWFGL